jgi:hypothetical protein
MGQPMQRAAFERPVLATAERDQPVAVFPAGESLGAGPDWVCLTRQQGRQVAVWPQQRRICGLTAENWSIGRSMALLLRYRLCSLLLRTFGLKSATGSYHSAGFNAPHRTVPVDLPHTPLQSDSGDGDGRYR